MNFPCASDLRFYESKHQPVWSTKIKKQAYVSPRSLVDECVNAHAGQCRSNTEIAVHNLLTLVAGWRRRGEDIQVRLLDVAHHPACAINPEKRAAFARKWAKRLARPSANHRD